MIVFGLGTSVKSLQKPHCPWSRLQSGSCFLQSRWCNTWPQIRLAINWKRSILTCCQQMLYFGSGITIQTELLDLTQLFWSLLTGAEQKYFCCTTVISISKMRLGGGSIYSSYKKYFFASKMTWTGNFHLLAFLKQEKKSSVKEARDSHCVVKCPCILFFSTIKITLSVEIVKWWLTLDRL